LFHRNSLDSLLDNLDLNDEESPKSVKSLKAFDEKDKKLILNNDMMRKMQLDMNNLLLKQQ
jgi:hypothetical protein